MVILRHANARGAARSTPFLRSTLQEHISINLELSSLITREWIQNRRNDQSEASHENTFSSACILAATDFI